MMDDAKKWKRLRSQNKKLRATLKLSSTIIEDKLKEIAALKVKIKSMREPDGKPDDKPRVATMRQAELKRRENILKQHLRDKKLK